ncbi:MAG: GNAT family N-acetyltransferase [Phycisphaerae bacterium]|nr:GNAT family N-acetyltransferase [Tepidisphaeraceae bacterium]
MAQIVKRVASKLRGARRRLRAVPGSVQRAWRTVFPPSFEKVTAPIEVGGLRAEVLEAWPTNPAVIAAWDALAARVPTATAFHTPLWIGPVVRHMVKAGRLRLIMVWDVAGTSERAPQAGRLQEGSALVGVIATHMRDDGLLETAGMSVTDYLDPLVDPAREADVWRAILKALAALRSSRRPTVTFHAVRDAATCRALLPELAKSEGFAYAEQIADHTPQITLKGTWDEFLATLDSHERKETRRKINKVMTKGAGRIVRCPADPAEIAKALAHTFVLMEQAAGYKGEFVKSTLRPLLETALPPLITAGKLWLTTLFVNDEPAAVTLQFPHPAGPMLYNCGYDNAKREWSPGVVLTAETIRLATEAGAPVYDMLRGQEPYKYKLGAVDKPLWMVSLTKRA